MSWNLCSLSGNPMEEPVVSKKTGHLFEKRLISKYIESTGECPITHQPLSLEDLIPLQVNKTIKPRAVNATSIPSLINTFQNEWDALMLETFSLKTHLETVRQELSHALYQHDAACRVIARLIRERDEARALLAQRGLKETNPEDKATNRLEQIMNNINEKAVELNSMRKKRNKNSEGFFALFPTQETLANSFQVKSSVALHSTTKPGILALDIHPENGNLLLTGGNDGHTLIFDKEKSMIACAFTKHQKRINDVVFVPDSSQISAITASDDHYAHFFSCDLEKKECVVQYSINEKREIFALGLHPLNYLVFDVVKDNSWSIHDLSVETCVLTNDSFVNAQFGLNSFKIHPDGHIMAFGTSQGSVKLWNITDNSLVESLESHTGEVNSLAFSENGFYFATGSTQQNVVNIWDLRKLSILHTISQQENESFKFSSMEFDASGQYLAVGSASGAVKLFNTKNWVNFAKYEGHKDAITAIKFQGEDNYMATSSLDRHLLIYSAI